MDHLGWAARADVDIVTFNLSERLDFNMLTASHRSQGERGVCLEIHFGPTLMGSSMRRNLICNGQNVYEKVSRNIISSSGTGDLSSVIEIDALAHLPADHADKKGASSFANFRSVI